MYSIGKTAQITREMRKDEIRILGVSERRWTGFGRLKTHDRETILYSGREDDLHKTGVALILDKHKTAWGPVNDRIITARFHSSFIKTAVIQVYNN
jgi:hypothetical protein